MQAITVVTAPTALQRLGHDSETAGDRGQFTRTCRSVGTGLLFARDDDYTLGVLHSRAHEV